ncbi:hypothetical protein C8R44DRAFT_881795 [Mycena epipterygia]|nr:hypothetical protein C8R44DRAFT_881795 [Mycena epipterygia]
MQRLADHVGAVDLGRYAESLRAGGRVLEELAVECRRDVCSLLLLAPAVDLVSRSIFTPFCPSLSPCTSRHPVLFHASHSRPTMPSIHNIPPALLHPLRPFPRTHNSFPAPVVRRRATLRTSSLHLDFSLHECMTPRCPCLPSSTSDLPSSYLLPVHPRAPLVSVSMPSVPLPALPLC